MFTGLRGRTLATSRHRLGRDGVGLGNGCISSPGQETARDVHGNLSRSRRVPGVSSVPETGGPRCAPTSSNPCRRLPPLPGQLNQSRIRSLLPGGSRRPGRGTSRSESVGLPGPTVVFTYSGVRPVPVRRSGPSADRTHTTPSCVSVK